jgi:hypothetical protein
MRDRQPGGRTDQPEAAQGGRRDAHRPDAPKPVAVPSGPAGRRVSWREWVRAQPILTAAVLVFCLVAIGGLFLSLPRGIWSTSRSGQSVGGPRGGLQATPAPEDPAKAPAAPEPTDEGQDARPAAPGPWTAMAPSPASPRGASLVYHYRTLPAGGESRYEWIVQVRGERSVLDDVEVVSWRMEPAAKNGAEFLSRDRAADGFPLFGHGPGGWFGVSATIRYRDGGEETLARRVELPE